MYYFECEGCGAKHDVARSQFEHEPDAMLCGACGVEVCFECVWFHAEQTDRPTCEFCYEEELRAGDQSLP